MGTKITIETDDPAIVAGIAELMTGKRTAPVVRGGSKEITAAREVVVDGQTVKAAPVVGAETAAPVAAAQPALTQQAAPATPPAAVDDPYKRLATAMADHAKTPGKSAATLGAVMRKYTDRAHDVAQPDGSVKQSVNRMHVPLDKIEACIADLKL